MKYQALRPQFFSMGGWGGSGVGRLWGGVGGVGVRWGGWVCGGDGGTHSVDMRPCGCFISYVGFHLNFSGELAISFKP